jgi:FADH2 O2-dependent halogenase
VDDAAVHHIFDGGWIWVLQFNNGITSAGVAATDEAAGRLRLSEGPAAWQCLLDLIPSLKNQFVDSEAVRPFTYMPCVSFRSDAVAGKRWALLPSAAGFVDPLLSTGFPLMLLGVSRLADIIERDWNKPQFSASLQSYGSQTDNELLAATDLIAALYATMDRFPAFASLTMLYFAAASFSETARRLGTAHLAPSFLLHSDRHFGPAMRQCFQHAKTFRTQTEMAELAGEISQAIEPINAAGLGNPHRRNWYPVDANDLLNSAAKLESTKAQISELLVRSGFWK